MYLPRFFVKQKFAMTTNRYEILAEGPGGDTGQLMGLAEQKRLAFKEKVTFFSDQSKTRPVFAFQARQVLELSAGYDVTDEAGRQIGFFRKDFGASLLRSTFHLEGPGYTGTGQERSMAVALMRRFLDFGLPIHFDFATPEGQPLLSIERAFALRDKYTVTVHDPRVDFRVAAAVAVAQDAMMQR